MSNTCGFIESAVQESLDAIGEAISKNGKVIVTGCLGKEADKIREMHPAVLAVTGAHAYDEVIRAVSLHVPKPDRSQDAGYDPKIDLINEAGIKLTPSHYAYLKISEVATIVVLSASFQAYVETWFHVRLTV